MASHIAKASTMPLFVFLIALFAATFQADGHEIRPTIASLNLPGNDTFELNVMINIEALLADIGPEHDDADEAPTAELYKQLRELSAEQLELEFRDYATDWLPQIGLMFGKQKAEFEIKQANVPETGDVELARNSEIILFGRIPEGATELTWALPEEFGSSVLRIERPGQEVEGQFFSAGEKSDPIKLTEIVPQSAWNVFVDYIVIGFTHIIPKGLDHILFVLGIFLLSPKWKPLLAQVTAFTLAHSVTLALGLYGIVNIAPEIVEPLIALSIVYVAVENIFTRKLHPWRPVIVFLFGLLHGLGFAGVLTAVGLQQGQFALGLIAFNIGVELGQLAIIALAFVLVGKFVEKDWYASRIAIPASVVIAAMGAYWVVERTLL